MKNALIFHLLLFFLIFNLNAAISFENEGSNVFFPVSKVNPAEVEAFIQNSALDKETGDNLKKFYEQRDSRFAWFENGGLAEHAYIYWNNYEYYLNYSKDSTLFYSDLSNTMAIYLEDANFKDTPEGMLRTELSLSSHFFRFAKVAYEGKVDPGKMGWHIPQQNLNVLALLTDFVAAKGKDEKAPIPINPQYELMRKKVLFLQKLKEENEFEKISLESRKAYKKGDSSKVIRELKKRLFILGDMGFNDTSTVYDETLRTAVISFQKRHGLKEDGIVGPKVIRTINIPLETKIQKLLLNLERMRWMPSPGDGKRIFVNIPEFKLHVYEGDEDVLSMNVVVGKEANRTVIFSDEIQNVVFSPYWNIPASIVRNEILPGIERHPNYLERHNMEMVGSRNGLPVIRQKPGKRNALGKVKFIFPNRYNIYLHDTPAKRLFERNSRAFSHGCIRVSEPFELAKYLLKNMPEWTDDRIELAMNSSSEQWVALSEKVPVYIAYFTAWVDAEGKLNLRPDIYGHDKKLSAELF